MKILLGAARAAANLFVSSATMSACAVLLGLLVCVSPIDDAEAWQTPQYSVPIGRGAGTGFDYSSPGAAGQVFASNGASAKPTFQNATTWLDTAFCNTVGYIIARTTGGWVCSRAIPINVVWLGADSTGVADSSTAFQTAATAIQTAGGGSIYMPATPVTGCYKINTQVTISDTPFTLFGDGIGATRVCVNNATGFFAATFDQITSTTKQWGATIRDFDVVAASGGAVSKGISVVGTNNYWWYNALNELIVERVRFTSTTAIASTEKFTTALYVKNISAPTISDVSIFQLDNLTGTSLWIDNDNAGGSFVTFGLLVRRINSQGMAYGIRSNGSIEGIIIESPSFIGCEYCIYADGSGGLIGTAPVLTITGGDNNARRYNIYTKNWIAVTIANVDMFKAPGTYDTPMVHIEGVTTELRFVGNKTLGTMATATTQPIIEFVDVNDVVFDSNITDTAGGTSDKGLSISGTSARITIGDNIWRKQGAGTSTAIDVANADQVTISPGNVFSGWSTNVNNSGSTNFRNIASPTGSGSGTTVISATAPLSVAATTGNLAWTGLTQYGLVYATTTSGVGTTSAGTSTTVLHGNASGAPTWGAVVSADLNITSTTCTNQFVTAISSGGVGTCTTDTLASAQHANQGTTTTVLHGNASGNPSWGQVAISTDVSGLGTNVATWLATPSSANLAAALTDETGSGAAVFASGPTLSGNPTISSSRLLLSGSWTDGTGNRGLINLTDTITNNADRTSGFYFGPTFNGNASGGANQVVGFDLNPTFSPSANTTSASGSVYGAQYSLSAGITVTNAIGLQAGLVYLGNTGTVTNGIGFRVNTPFATGTLKPATNYGMFFQNQGLAGVTTSYGIWMDAQSGSTTNYALYYNSASPTVLFASGGLSVGGSTDPGGGSFATTAFASIGTKIRAGGSAPTVGTCGTSPSISGSDLAGTVTTGSTATTACTITFNAAYASAPYCTATPDGAANSGLYVTSSASTLVLTYTSATSAKFHYLCIARSAGWLLNRDINPTNDNQPMFLEKAA